MNPFVNLQKRSIQLPKGCKDLMDVLRPVEGPLPGNWRPVYDENL